MIDTLTTSCYLFKTHKWRYRYQDSMDKRRVLCLSCAITFCVAISVIIYLIYG